MVALIVVGLVVRVARVVGAAAKASAALALWERAAAGCRAFAVARRCARPVLGKRAHQRLDGQTPARVLMGRDHAREFKIALDVAVADAKEACESEAATGGPKGKKKQKYEQSTNRSLCLAGARSQRWKHHVCGRQRVAALRPGARAPALATAPRMGSGSKPASQVHLKQNQSRFACSAPQRTIHLRDLEGPRKVLDLAHSVGSRLLLAPRARGAGASAAKSVAEQQLAMRAFSLADSARRPPRTALGSPPRPRE